MSHKKKTGFRDTVFTTGQVAKICKVAPRTVSKWFDKKMLKGYVIPGGQDRRVPIDDLIRFLKEHGMPLGELEAYASTIRVCFFIQSLGMGLESIIERVKTQEDTETEVFLHESLFAFAQDVSAHPPHLVVYQVPFFDGAMIKRTLQQIRMTTPKMCPPMKIFGIVGEDHPDPYNQKDIYQELGFDKVMQCPLDPVECFAQLSHLYTDIATEIRK